MMVGKAAGLGFEIISKLDSNFLMTVPKRFLTGIQWISEGLQLWILRVPKGSLGFLLITLGSLGGSIGFINFPAKGLVLKIM